MLIILTTVLFSLPMSFFYYNMQIVPIVLWNVVIRNEMSFMNLFNEMKAYFSKQWDFFYSPAWWCWWSIHDSQLSAEDKLSRSLCGVVCTAVTHWHCHPLSPTFRGPVRTRRTSSQMSELWSSSVSVVTVVYWNLHPHQVCLVTVSSHHSTELETQ